MNPGDRVMISILETSYNIPHKEPCLGQPETSYNIVLHKGLCLASFSIDSAIIAEALRQVEED
jgi:hypothetical protein